MIHYLFSLAFIFLLGLTNTITAMNRIIITPAPIQVAEEEGTAPEFHAGITSWVKEKPELAIRQALASDIRDQAVLSAYLQVSIHYASLKPTMNGFLTVMEVMELIKAKYGDSFLAETINYQDTTNKSCTLLFYALDAGCSYQFFLYLVEHGADLTLADVADRTATYIAAKNYTYDQKFPGNASETKKLHTRTILVHLLQTPGLDHLSRRIPTTDTVGVRKILFDSLLLDPSIVDQEVTVALFTSPNLPVELLDFGHPFYRLKELPLLDYRRYILLVTGLHLQKFSFNPIYYLALMGDHERVARMAEQHSELITHKETGCKSALDVALERYQAAVIPHIKEKYRQVLVLFKDTLAKKGNAAANTVPRLAAPEAPVRARIPQTQLSKKGPDLSASFNLSNLLVFVTNKHWDACLGYLQRLKHTGCDLSQLLNASMSSGDHRGTILMAAIRHGCPYPFYLKLRQLGAQLTEGMLAEAVIYYMPRYREGTDATYHAEDIIIDILSNATLPDINKRIKLPVSLFKCDIATVAIFIIATGKPTLINSLFANAALDITRIDILDNGIFVLSEEGVRKLNYSLAILKNRKPTLKKLPQVPEDKNYGVTAAFIGDPFFAEQVCLSDPHWLLKRSKPEECVFQEGFTVIDIILRQIGIAQKSRPNELIVERYLKTLDVFVKYAVKNFDSSVPLVSAAYANDEAAMYILAEMVSAHTPPTAPQHQQEHHVAETTATTATTPTLKERRQRIAPEVQHVEELPQPAAGSAMSKAEREALEEARRLEDEENAGRKAQIERDRLQREAAARTLAEQKAADERERAEQAELTRERERNAAERDAQEQEIARINRLRARNARDKEKKEARRKAAAEAAQREQLIKEEQAATTIAAVTRGFLDRKKVAQLKADARAEAEALRHAQQQAAEAELQRQRMLREEAAQAEAMQVTQASQTNKVNLSPTRLTTDLAALQQTYLTHQANDIQRIGNQLLQPHYQVPLLQFRSFYDQVKAALCTPIPSLWWLMPLFVEEKVDRYGNIFYIYRPEVIEALNLVDPITHVTIGTNFAHLFSNQIFSDSPYMQKYPELLPAIWRLLRLDPSVLRDPTMIQYLSQ